MRPARTGSLSSLIFPGNSDHRIAVPQISAVTRRLVGLGRIIMATLRLPHFITAPTPLGLRPPAPGRIPGVRGMPRALIAAGLLDGLPHCPRTDLPEPLYSAELAPPAGVRNLAGLAAFTTGLADTVAAALDAGSRPIVIGGDCSVLLGPALALRRRGRYALVHVDAHNDFGHEGNFGAPYPNAAGADLALVTGRRP